MNREEAMKRTEMALSELGTSLKLGKSEQLLQYLAVMAKFRNYSFGNCVLIYFQKPEASHIAGFQKWKEMGRFVKKGEQGISILAPLVRKKAVTGPSSEPTKEDQEKSQVKKLLGFRVVHVFDVSQTDGAPLPEFASLQGDPGDLFERLEDRIRERGIDLCYEAQLPGGAYGLSYGGKIRILSTLPRVHQFSTMVHELAHELLHWGDRRAGTTKAVRETEAEAVAYIVCRSIGLECSTRASDYIQLWQGDEKLLLQSMDWIRGVASQILKELDEPTESATFQSLGSESRASLEASQLG